MDDMLNEILEASKPYEQRLKFYIDLFKDGDSKRAQKYADMDLKEEKKQLKNKIQQIKKERMQKNIKMKGKYQNKNYDLIDITQKIKKLITK